MKRFLFALIPLFLIILVACNKSAEEYESKSKKIADEMFDNASTAENIINEYLRIWEFSIESRSPLSIKEMVNFTGLDESDVVTYFEINNANNIPNDFSSNVNSLMAYYASTGILEQIDNKSSDIKKAVSDLKDVPKGYDKLYDEILNMYDITEQYVRMASSPSGSLSDFRSRKKELTDEILRLRDRIDVLLTSND